MPSPCADNTVRPRSTQPARTRRATPLICSLLVALLPIGARAAGIYVDAAGGRHAWKINDGHALIWEEKPYLPAGLALRAASLAPEAAAGTWEADQAEIERARAAGVNDLLIRGPGSLAAA